MQKLTDDIRARRERMELFYERASGELARLEKERKKIIESFYSELEKLQIERIKSELTYAKPGKQPRRKA